MRTVLVSGISAIGLAFLPAAAASGAAHQGGQAGETAPTWRLAKVNTLPGDDVLDDVTVLGNGSVWAAGHRVVNGTRRGLVERFDGRSWKVLPGSPSYELTAVTAGSDKNVWVFGPGKASRWNGRTWTTFSLGSGFSTTDADGTGAKDVWAVADSSASARHWNGSSWRSVPLPAHAAAVDAYKAGDVWAAGAKGTRPAIMRWNGKSWALVPTPAIKLPARDAAAVLTDIAVLGPRNVWAVGGVSWEGADDQGDDKIYDRPLVMHWNGRSWTASVGAVNAQPYTEVEPDGAGGVWIVQSDWNSTLWHVTGSTWRSTPIPRKAGTDAALFSIARRPGTTTLWGAGFTAPQGDPDDPSANGAFWRTN
ncbi:hypothetical protein OHB01_13840 [Microbispora hainanensis]|uniref:Uncharacterized protein n=1 Tax=Microbispora hainanensis TaxID=568844 RepID=A0ABZ1SLE1_9ACTN|nr:MULTISPECIES: hypothetical protein [Microbispora]NJP25557.1 hypothetical protein [Microbispora sp. CL1-1]TQS13509.1 hypothetical protein FLW53_15410 [Microbispora sp. SCL1-1]